MNNVMLPVMGSMKKKKFESAAFKWYGLFYRLFYHTS